MSKILKVVALFIVLALASKAQAQTVNINWTDVHQPIDGFGACDAWTGYGITDSQADLFWSTTKGVGLSLLRIEVMEDGSYPDLATMQKAQARGVTIWGTPWSPPASMKSNGNVDNGGSLLTSSYQTYANFLANYVLTLKTSHGINLSALSIQNEPDYVASYDSGSWTDTQFHDFLLNNLAPTFANDGISAKIMMPEESHWAFDLADTTLNDPRTAAKIGIYAAHGYGDSVATAEPQIKNTGSRLWETEVSDFSAPDPSIASGLAYARQINDWMTISEANAWHFWWLINANNDNEGLIQSDGTVTKRLYTIGNFSKFVRPGYVRIGTDGSAPSGVSISAYKGSNGDFAIVAINQNGSDVPLNIVLNGFTTTSIVPWVTSASLNLSQQSSITIGGGSFSATLPASSVTTFVSSAAAPPAPPMITGVSIQ